MTEFDNLEIPSKDTLVKIINSRDPGSFGNEGLGNWIKAGTFVVVVASLWIFWLVDFGHTVIVMVVLLFLFGVLLLLWLESSRKRRLWLQEKREAYQLLEEITQWERAAISRGHDPAIKKEQWLGTLLMLQRRPRGWLTGDQAYLSND
ncbi:MAG: hypothetical protein OXH65_05115 [Paracoccaceae bacterium]|nr:hypothetical protein [Paracoccaceae bacterium]